jgi:hypothetical protein
MSATLEHYTARDQLDIMSATRALDEAQLPLARATFRALGDATLRAGVKELLRAEGRTLIETPSGFTSGYDNDVRRALTADGIGVLSAEERAVLTLVLLHCVAIPRADGRIPPERADDWTHAVPVHPETLRNSRHLTDSSIADATRRLRDADILAYGAQRLIKPGPQFHRLTPEVIADLYDDLVLLAEPNGMLAESIQRRRTREGTPS